MESESSTTAYVELPDHPHKLIHGVVLRTIDLDELLKYEGPKIYLDLDNKNRLIGIEILASSTND